ncbi:MAG: PAS domain-containing protein, partial [Mariprofundaceae bacterium]|nr:PAS domain-containing protein [Mariprofundaceae bacterium]
MNKCYQPYKKIEISNYFQSLAALVFFVIIGWVFVHSHHVDLTKYARMALLLQNLSREDVIFQQRILSIEAHHIHHYDHLAKSQKEIDHLIKNLQDLDQKNNIKAHLKVYQTLVNTRNALSNHFLSSYAVMRNSMLSLPKSLQMMESDLSSLQFYQIDRLVHTAFRFHNLHHSAAYQKVMKLSQSLALESWARQEKVIYLFQHVHLFAEKSQKVRETSKKIANLSGAADIRHMQKIVQQECHRLERLVNRDNTILYISCVFLLLIIVCAFLKLQRTASYLRKTIGNLDFQQRALDQHAIVSIANASGQIIYANEQFIENSQYSKEDLLGQQHRIVKSGYHSDDFFKKLWGTISSGKTWQGEMCNKRKDGTLFWVQTTIVPFMTEDNKPHRYISIRTNISKNKAMEAELKAHHSELEEQVRQRTLSLQSTVQQLQQEVRTRKSA